MNEKEATKCNFGMLPLGKQQIDQLIPYLYNLMHDLIIHFVDVGQGDCILISKNVVKIFYNFTMNLYKYCTRFILNLYKSICTNVVIFYWNLRYLYKSLLYLTILQIYNKICKMSAWQRSH